MTCGVDRNLAECKIVKATCTLFYYKVLIHVRDIIICHNMPIHFLIHFPIIWMIPPFPIFPALPTIPIFPINPIFPTIAGVIGSVGIIRK